MFAEFVATYVPFAIAAVIIVPVVLVHIAMFVESVRTRRWPRQASPAASGLERAAEARRAARRESRRPMPTLTGGHGLRHGVAARRDHD
jgi:hypothetical protein